MAYVIWIVYNQWGISILFLALAFIVATRKIEILIVTRRLKAIRRVFPYPVLLFISIYSIVISSSLHSYSRLVLKHANLNVSTVGQYVYVCILMIMSIDHFTKESLIMIKLDCTQPPSAFLNCKKIQFPLFTKSWLFRTLNWE